MSFYPDLCASELGEYFIAYTPDNFYSLLLVDLNVHFEGLNIFKSSEEINYINQPKR